MCVWIGDCCCWLGAFKRAAWSSAAAAQRSACFGVKGKSDEERKSLSSLLLVPLTPHSSRHVGHTMAATLDIQQHKDAKKEEEESQPHTHKSCFFFFKAKKKYIYLDIYIHNINICSRATSIDILMPGRLVLTTVPRLHVYEKKKKRLAYAEMGLICRLLLLLFILCGFELPSSRGPSNAGATLTTIDLVL